MKKNSVINTRRRFKRTLSSLCIASLLSSSIAFAEDFSVDRLSLFIHDGANSYEYSELGKSTQILPNSLGVSFNAQKLPSGESIWKWTIKNKGSATLKDLRITSFIDLDIDAKNNTFFNEYGELINLNVPTGYLAPDRWEISEPGYKDGDLLQRASSGNLHNTSYQTVATVDDTAMALSIPVELLVSGDELEVTAILTADTHTEGLIQKDNLSTKSTPSVFQVYAKKIPALYGSEKGVSQTALIVTGALLNERGEVWVWGFRRTGQDGNGSRVISENAAPAKVKSLNNIRTLSGGAYHLIALSHDGDLYGWGQSAYGETGCVSGSGGKVMTPCKVLSDVMQVASGTHSNIARDSQGRVWTFGNNEFGQLGDGTNNHRYKPAIINLNGEKARLVGATYEGAFVVTEEGHVWGWGDNEASGLGIKGSDFYTHDIIRTPTRIPNLEPYANQIVYISGGNGWGEALLNDGTVIGWGLHASLGIGVSSTDIHSPEPVVIMKNVKHLFARTAGSVALTNDNKIYTWGETEKSSFPMIYGNKVTLRDNIYGNVVEIGGGFDHIFYKSDDGNLYGVGFNGIYKLKQSSSSGQPIDWPGEKIKVER